MYIYNQIFFFYRNVYGYLKGDTKDQLYSHGGGPCGGYEALTWGGIPAGGYIGGPPIVWVGIGAGIGNIGGCGGGMVLSTPGMAVAATG